MQPVLLKLKDSSQPLPFFMLLELLILLTRRILIAFIVNCVPESMFD